MSSEEISRIKRNRFEKDIVNDVPIIRDMISDIVDKEPFIICCVDEVEQDKLYHLLNEYYDEIAYLSYKCTKLECRVSSLNRTIDDLCL